MSATVQAAAPAARFPAQALRRYAGAVGVAALVGVLAADNGGYFATSWGWATLALAWGAAMALLLSRRVLLSSPEIGLLAAMGAFVAWLGLSILWSAVRVESVDELERALVYLAGLLALVLLVRSRSVATLLAGLTLAIALVCAYGLATRLFPDRVGGFDSIVGYRLSDPVGYWNALGILAAIGALLAIGFAARARRVASRVAAAAAIPLLLLTVEFTFSRGSWLAFAVGLAVMAAIDPRRLQLFACLLALAPASVLAVWTASRSTALTTVGSSLSRASSQGHRVALVLAAAAVLSACAAGAIAYLEPRVSLGDGLRRTLGFALVAIVLVAATAGIMARGGPAAVARKAVHSFEAHDVNGRKLSSRVFSLSSNGRSDLWRAAWHEFESRPLLGGGAGSFEQYWRAHRSSTLEVRDAHSLYLETLAELGVVGLALLLVVLGLPFLAARHRHVPLVAAALGAFAAFLVHAGVDWDWEMPAVTLAGLACGAAALIAARDEDARRELGPALRYGLAAGLVAVGAFASITLLGNRALDAGQAAAAAKNWSKAASDARSARTWLRWSPEPWRLLGDASFGRGDFASAARDYRRAIALDPRNWELWYDLGFATSGNESDAAFARARSLDPRNPDIPKEATRAR
jgi:hypothetical protein